jgi:hypothetical protein
MDNKIVFIELVVVGAVLLVLLWFFGFRLLYDYEALEKGVSFFVFRRIKVWTIPYASVERVQIVAWNDLNSLAEASPFALKLGNRWGKRYVSLRRKHGLIKELHLTPSSGEAFVRTVNTHLTAVSQVNTEPK